MTNTGACACRQVLLVSNCIGSYVELIIYPNENTVPDPLLNESIFLQY